MAARTKLYKFVRHNNARMNNHTELNLGEVVYISLTISKGKALISKRTTINRPALQLRDVLTTPHAGKALGKMGKCLSLQPSPSCPFHLFGTFENCDITALTSISFVFKRCDWREFYRCLRVVVGSLFWNKRQIILHFCEFYFQIIALFTFRECG